MNPSKRQTLRSETRFHGNERCLMKRHVPFHIVSGFLGSGKTTLLNRILRESHGRRFAVIVNEFGEVGLDDKMLDLASEDFVRMDNGCLCCALNEDLAKTLEKLSKRDDYDAVILETTGVADPLPVTWTFYREAHLGAYRFGGIVTVVDVLHFDKMLARADDVRVQVDRGDFLYLSKTDRCEESRIQKVVQEIRKINSFAKILDSRDKAWMDLIFDFEPNEERQNFASQTQTEGHHHEHGADYDSVSQKIPEAKCNTDKMEEIFENLPSQVFRAKAVFWDTDKKKAIAMHAVCGRVEFYELCGKSAADVPNVAVFIGKNLGEGLMPP